MLLLFLMLQLQLLLLLALGSYCCRRDLSLFFLVSNLYRPSLFRLFFFSFRDGKAYKLRPVKPSVHTIPPAFSSF